MSRRFELLKDLPNARAGLVMWENDEYYDCHDDMGEFFYLKNKTVENNPLWFKEIKDTEESCKPPLINDYEAEKLYDWVVDSGRKPSITAFTSSKARDIAREVEFLLSGKMVKPEESSKPLTEKEIEKREKDAFEAGRERVGGFWNDQIKNWEYISYEDYRFRRRQINSIPAGKGTANDVLNSEGVNAFRESWKYRDGDVLYPQQENKRDGVKEANDLVKEKNKKEQESKRIEVDGFGTEWDNGVLWHRFCIGGRNIRPDYKKSIKLYIEKILNNE